LVDGAAPALPLGQGLFSDCLHGNTTTTSGIAIGSGAYSECSSEPIKPHSSNTSGWHATPRIGIDIGGVLTRDGDPNSTNILQWGPSWEAPGAFDAVRAIVEMFEPENVFLVSKVRPQGSMHRQTVRWLRTSLFHHKTGVLADNVVYVSAADGPDGKGVVASRLGLSHFVDDKLAVLESVFADKAGNSGHLVERFNGTLFHFASGGSGVSAPSCFQEREAKLRGHYFGVAGWSQVLERLHLDSSMPARRAVAKMPQKKEEMQLQNSKKAEEVADQDEVQLGAHIRHVQSQVSTNKGLSLRSTMISLRPQARMMQKSVVCQEGTHSRQCPTATPKKLASKAEEHLGWDDDAWDEDLKQL